MAKTVYECMFIFSANAYARNPTAAAAAVEELAGNVDGELLASRMFDERKLAYPIRNQRKGVYWLAYINMESTSISKFNRACQLKDMVLRHLVVKIDPRLVDTMVAVARGNTPEEAAPESTETASGGGEASESSEKTASAT